MKPYPKPYLINYSECFGETQTVQFRGYSAAHAEERFFDSFESEGGSEGVRVISIHHVHIRNGQPRFTR